MNADLTYKCLYLFESLKKKKVSSFEIWFSGSGDDGQLEWGNISYKEEMVDDFWDEPTIFSYSNLLGKENITFDDLAMEIAEGVIDFYDIDYQNNEGNNGRIRFNVDTGEISTSYQVYETKTEYTYI